MRILLLLVGVLLAAPTSARAAPSEGTAQVLATTGTLVPIAGLGFATFGRTGVPGLWKPVIATSYVALLIAPSSGHFYAGEYVTVGMGIRLVGALAVGGGFMAMDCDSGRSMFCIPPGVVPVLLGTVTMIVGAGWDMATVDNAVRESQTSARMFSIGGAF